MSIVLNHFLVNFREPNNVSVGVRAVVRRGEPRAFRIRVVAVGIRKRRIR